jgi:hypothetical protein
MSDTNITIPNVDGALAQKLEAVVDAIGSAIDTFQTTSNGLGFTQSSVNSAVASIVDISVGRAVDQLSSVWSGTSSDGRKADSGLTGVIPHLNSLKGTINEHLPAIRTGLTGIQTALDYQRKAQEVEADIISRLQGQINDLITALGAIAGATGPVNTGINSIIVGGSCSNGIQPGDPLPTFDNRTFMTKKGPDGKPSPDDMRRARADADQARTNAANAENAGNTATSRYIDRATKQARRTVEDAVSGTIRRAGNYHGKLPPELEAQVLREPDAVYLSTGTRGGFIFVKDGNMVFTEGVGSQRGRVVTSYGPGGPRGESGAAARGGSPGDPHPPVTHDEITGGTLPDTDGGTLPPAIQILP